MRSLLRSLKFVAFLLIAVISVTSCLDSESDYEKQVKIDDKILAQFVENNSLTTAQRHSSGFYYIALESDVESTGAQIGTPVKKGDVVTFNYTISRLTNSMTTMQTSVPNLIESYEGAKVKILSRTIIPEALDYGISLMKVGDKYRFLVPSYLAFGSYRSQHFAPNSNFIIDVTVVDVDTESNIDDAQREEIANYVAINYPQAQNYASGLYFIDSIPGSGKKPFDSDRVVIDFKRKLLDNTNIGSAENAAFFLNTASAVLGLEEGLKLMREGGHSILIMPSSIGFKQSLCVVPDKARAELFRDRLINTDVRPYTILKYVVNLKTVN